METKSETLKKRLLDLRTSILVALKEVAQQASQGRERPEVDLTEAGLDVFHETADGKYRVELVGVSREGDLFLSCIPVDPDDLTSLGDPQIWGSGALTEFSVEELRSLLGSVERAVS